MHRAQQQRAVFSRVAALAVQERHALIELDHLAHDLFILVADDIGKLRRVLSVNDQIEHLGRDIKRERTVESIVQALEHRGVDHDDRQVDAEADIADRKSPDA